MQISITIRLPSPSFWLSLLLHALVLLCCLLVLTSQYEDQKTKTPNLYTPTYVPSYMYTGSIATPKASSSAANKENTTILASTAHPDRTGDLSASQQISSKTSIASSAKNKVNLASILSSTQSVLQNHQLNSLNTTKNSEPIYLIGEMDGAADPLIKLLGISLSANFKYPEMEGELGIKGRVLIGLTLHPEGYFSNIEILQSSHNHDFDAAALYAVNQAPAIPGADRFISESKHFVIGFIFR